MGSLQVGENFLGGDFAPEIVEKTAKTPFVHHKDAFVHL